MYMYMYIHVILCETGLKTDQAYARYMYREHVQTPAGAWNTTTQPIQYSNKLPQPPEATHMWLPQCIATVATKAVLFKRDP